MPIIANACWICCSNIICSHKTRGTRSCSASRHSDGLDEKIPSCSAWKHGNQQKICKHSVITSVSRNLRFDMSWSLSFFRFYSKPSKTQCQTCCFYFFIHWSLGSESWSNQTWQRPQQPKFIWIQYLNYMCQFMVWSCTDLYRFPWISKYQ